MKLNTRKHQFNASGLALGIVIFAILALAGSGISTSLAQVKSQKRITSLQSGDTSAGTRVSLFSDSVLNDYEAFRRGDRFYVKIPFAGFDAAQPNLRGDGFEDIQIQRVGDSLVVSFKLRPGVTARVDQRSNRLDVYFTTQNQASRVSKVNSSPNHSATPAIPGIVTLQNTRTAQPQRNSNSAGPMPPDTPTASRPRVVTESPLVAKSAYKSVEQGSGNRAASNERSSRPESRLASSGASTKTTGSGNLDSPAVQSTSPSTFIPSATPTNPGTTSATPYSPISPKPIVPAPPVSGSSWSKRQQMASQWISSNRLPASIGAAVLFGLIILASAMLYRRRKKPVNGKRAKVQGVKPKYSSGSEIEGFEDGLGEGAYETVFDDYQTRVREPRAEVNLPYADDLSTSEQGIHWADVVPGSSVVETATASRPTSSDYDKVPTIPVHAMKHEEYEREVFEL